MFAEIFPYLSFGVVLVLLIILIVKSAGKGKTSEIEKGITEIRFLLQTQMAEFFKAQREGSKDVNETLERMRNDNAENIKYIQEAMKALREEVSSSLESIRNDNNAKLDEIRHTVDEKLQETLDKKITASFEQVTKNLEQLYTSIGEINKLSGDVSSLNKMLGNVKTRGAWGEAEVEQILSDMLHPTQYEKNFTVKGRNTVEFAIRLPGGSSGDAVYLPIDSKFPVEDYMRFVDASLDGNIEEANRLSSEIRNRVKKEAQDIRDKYISPPRTTDFAILFVATESLYAELLRMPGFAEELQKNFSVVLTGPMNFAAMINSLQIGFKTLQIQKNTKEVWKHFKEIRKQFEMFGSDLEAGRKAIKSAGDRIDAAYNRSSRIAEKLDRIEIPEERKEELFDDYTTEPGNIE